MITYPPPPPNVANETAQASSVRRVFASFRSAVSKPWKLAGKNLFSVIGYLQKQAGLQLHVTVGRFKRSCPTVTAVTGGA